jgi:hypothetical protein
MGWTVLTGLAAIATIPLFSRPAVSAGTEKDAEVDRARQQVKMLDDLYKTAVVLITEHYVQEDSDVPAGTAAKKLFEAMKAKGWHEVRLIDATGQPIEEQNAPQKGFETKALEKLNAGETFVDEVAIIDNKRYFRAATPIPVVLDKCVMCHEHYKKFQKDGKIIGMLGYTVPIE